jgi:hypothetical protein
MSGQKSLAASLLLAACLCAAGCGWFGAHSDDGVEEEFADSADGPVPVSSAVSTPATATSKSERRLQAGDRFPLLKTVNHTLQQASPQGWVTSRSTLELLMTVTLEEVPPSDHRQPELDARSGQKRWQVTYHRLRFSQELPGQPRIDYDSTAPSGAVPPVAMGYHGLRNNGFGFWLGPDNQILELAAFDQFLVRCLQDVPAERRQQAAAALVFPTAADAVASLIDDTVGVLPATAIHEGDTWMRDRHVVRPVPLHISNKYTLRQNSAGLADVEIQGTISAPVPHGSINPPSRDVSVAVRGGKSQGTCVLDRLTGLPVESRVEQALEMTARLPDGTEFDQHKTTLTTIKSLSGTESAPAGPGTVGAVGSAVRPPPRAALGTVEQGPPATSVRR